MQSEVNFLFALGKAWEDRGDYERAWAYYQEGNTKQRADVAYDPVRTEAASDRLIDTFSGDFLASRAGVGLPDPAPIFIVGLPRSGSTLLEQILASHSQVEGTGELPYVPRVANSLNRNRADGITYPEAALELGPSHFRSLGEEYLAYARQHLRSDTPRFIDKMPNNFPQIGFMSLILPTARIIDARRHPLDACLSCYRQLFAKGQEFTYDLTEIGEYYLQYQRMMDHWAAVLPGRVLTVAVRGGRRGLREPGQTPARVLRTAVGGRLPALLRERAAHTHPERGAGPPADLRSLGRVTGAITRSTSTSSWR